MLLVPFATGCARGHDEDLWRHEPLAILAAAVQCVRGHARDIVGALWGNFWVPLGDTRCWLYVLLAVPGDMLGPLRDMCLLAKPGDVLGTLRDACCWLCVLIAVSGDMLGTVRDTCCWSRVLLGVPGDMLGT